LSEFCANAGYNRKYAIRLLNGPRPERCKSEPRRGRGVSYSQEVVALLTAVWEAVGGRTEGACHQEKLYPPGFLQT